MFKFSKSNKENDIVKAHRKNLINEATCALYAEFSQGSPPVIEFNRDIIPISIPYLKLEDVSAIRSDFPLKSSFFVHSIFTYIMTSTFFSHIVQTFAKNIFPMLIFNILLKNTLEILTLYTRILELFLDFKYKCTYPLSLFYKKIYISILFFYVGFNEIFFTPQAKKYFV